MFGLQDAVQTFVRPMKRRLLANEATPLHPRRLLTPHELLLCLLVGFWRSSSSSQ